MTKEYKQQFTMRITQANKTEMIVILYEMLLTYMKDAEEALTQKEFTAFHEAVRKVRGCLEELIASVNLDCELGLRLFSLYQFCNRELIKADARKKKEPLAHIRSVIEKLRDAYKELAKQDESGPVMQNSQTVYAGLTYGKNSLSENMADQGTNRGFRA